MRVYFGAAICAALWLGMPGAYAEPQADSVQIKAPQTVRLAPGEFDEYAASYDLSNGQRIVFFSRGQRYFARLDGEVRTEILPRAAGVFATAAGVRMEFSDKGAAVTIRNFERLVTSVALPADTVMVASR
jgi:hypothetical protein